MKDMYVKIFGTPKIKVNNIVVSPSLKRGEALLYYMVINKRAYRDDIINLLWNGLENQKARKNLRNLLYKLKQDIGFDFIISLNREILALNPDVRVTSDYGNFFDKIGEHEGEVLKGFSFKDASAFENWKKELTQDIRKKNLETGFLKLEAYIKSGEFERAELFIKKMLKLDPLNETLYFNLMKIFSEEENIEEFINTYSRLCNVLEKSSGRKPGKEIEEYYRNFFETVKKSGENNRDINYNKNNFVMRDQELIILEEEYRRFIEEDIKKILLIWGESGIGKTFLLNKFLSKIETKETDIIYYNCIRENVNDKFRLLKEIFYQSRKLWEKDSAFLSEFFLKYESNIYPLLEESDLILEREDYNKELGYIEKFMKVLFGEVKRKFIIAVDNIQWADKLSLSLLARRIPDLKGRVLFICTGSEEGGPWVKDFLTICVNYDEIRKINLNRFNLEKTFEFIKHIMPIISVLFILSSFSNGLSVFNILSHLN